ncbi:MAG TPA: ABC transporter permease [Gemmatimonadaceae bacterium]|nr:ABC transporter permease [Gemmatimonadaceae bacterium]
MDRLLTDLVHSLRRLARAPGFATIAIVTLALGIGANTAIFSLVKTVLLRPLPFGDAERLMMIWGSRDKGETTWLAGPEVLDYANEKSTFEYVAAYTSSAANLTGGQEPERVMAAAVTPNVFQALRVAPLLGRSLSPTDEPSAIANEVVLAHGLWQRRFGGNRDIIGQSIQVNGSARTVIGVMPPSFKLPLDFSGERPTELWVPLDLESQDWSSWGDHSLIGFARLQSGIGVQRANAGLKAAEDRWVRDGHWSNRDNAGRGVVPMKDLVLGDVRYALWVLLGAVGVILLIACANVANLMLARSDERHREIAVRTALGASRARIVRQLLTESVFLSLVGGLVGIALAYGGLRMLLAAHPAGIPRVADVGLDGIVLLFSLFLTVATGMTFGLAPALELSRPDLSRSLKEGGRTGTVGRARQRFRDSLAVAQMAFSVILLIGATLLVRSLMELRRIDLGFSTERALTVRTALPQSSYRSDQDVIAFVRTLRQRIGELPGVRSVGATRLLPLTGTIGDWSITLEGRPRVEGENPNGDWQVATPGYFETMGMKLIRGRFFTDADHEKAPLVAVINETMAKRYWPSEDAIGKRFHIGSRNQPWITIVGIVGQVRHNAITETARAEMYVSHAQWAAAGASASRGMTYVIRTNGDPLALLGYVRQLVRSMDPNLPLADVRTLQNVADDSLSQTRFTTQLLTLFAALALTLAAVGIYGVISLLVTRRRQEIGIRIALGAKTGAILGMVVKRGMVLAAVGVGLGLMGAAGLSGILGSLLYGVTRFDPVTFSLVPAILAGVALLACVIPAGRAAAVDPVTALREE